MTLGQMIQHLRREKGMLQDELADTLGVSRQSVSKWETDAAVPELDKLLRLADLFGVTLDELVRGERMPAPEATAQPPPPPPTIPEPTFPPRKLAGTLLLCFGGLAWLFMMLVFGDLLSGLVLASPFLICGAICFIFRRRVGLWCAWTVYLLVEAYLQWATGTTRGAIFLPHFYRYGNPAHVIMAWGLMLILLVLVIVTLRSYRGMSRPSNRGLFLSGGTAVLVYVGKWCTSLLFNLILQRAGSYSAAEIPLTLLRFLQFTLDWCMIASLTILLVRLTALIRARRK